MDLLATTSSIHMHIGTTNIDYKVNSDVQVVHERALPATICSDFVKRMYAAWAVAQHILVILVIGVAYYSAVFRLLLVGVKSCQCLVLHSLKPLAHAAGPPLVCRVL